MRVLAHAEVQIAAGVAPAAAVGALPVAGGSRWAARSLPIPSARCGSRDPGRPSRRSAPAARGAMAFMHLARGDAGGHAFGVGREMTGCPRPSPPAVRRASSCCELPRQFGKRLRVRGESAVPRGFCLLRRARRAWRKCASASLGDVERRLHRPAQVLAWSSCTSSSPSGEPCASNVSCLCGEP